MASNLIGGRGNGAVQFILSQNFSTKLSLQYWAKILERLLRYAPKIVKRNSNLVVVVVYVHVLPWSLSSLFGQIVSL